MQKQIIEIGPEYRNWSTFNCTLLFFVVDVAACANGVAGAQAAEATLFVGAAAALCNWVAGAQATEAPRRCTCTT